VALAVVVLAVLARQHLEHLELVAMEEEHLAHPSLELQLTMELVAVAAALEQQEVLVVHPAVVLAEITLLVVLL
jgi:hypothetical protein